jgi:hypothetical protein
VRNNIFINQVFIFSTKIPVLHVWKGTITIDSKPDSIYKDTLCLYSAVRCRSSLRNKCTYLNRKGVSFFPHGGNVSYIILVVGPV